jgi:P4 family phage/plasmid primase-like protien
MAAIKLFPTSAIPAKTRDSTVGLSLEEAVKAISNDPNDTPQTWFELLSDAPDTAAGKARGETGLNRVYIDIDGRIGEDTTPARYDELRSAIEKALLAFNPDYCVMKSSSYKYRKLSFRLHHTKLYGTKKEIENFIINTELPKLKEILEPIITFYTTPAKDKVAPYLEFDKGIYGQSRYMRCCNSHKPKMTDIATRRIIPAEPTRPLLIISNHKPIDSLITYIPPDAERLESPTELNIISRRPGRPRLTETAQETVAKTSIDVLREAYHGLNRSRFIAREDWIKLGLLAFNIGLDCEDWDEMSNEASSYTPDCCFKEWRSFKSDEGGVREGTLWFFLKEDNSELYSRLRARSTDQLTELYNSHTEHKLLAKYFYSQYPTDYIYNSDNREWFWYDSNNILQSGSLPDIFFYKVSDTLQKYMEECYTISEAENRDKMRAKIKQTFNNVPFINHIISILPPLYKNNKLEIDSNPNIIAFKNGWCYDLATREYRGIERLDFITKTVGYNCSETDCQQTQQRVADIVRSCFSTKEDTDYWLGIVGASLFGNKSERFYCHTGSGGNGKSLLLSTFLAGATGDYCYTTDNTFFTSILSSGRANPSLAQCEGRRILLCSEPDDGSGESRLNIDFVKTLTGRDAIPARDLFKTVKLFMPQFTPHLLCNTKPVLNKLDLGIIRRIRVVEYPYNFVEKVIGPNEKKIDKELKSWFSSNDTAKYAFLRILIDAAERYLDGKIAEPASIELATTEYIRENDPVREWFETNYERTDSETDRITASDFYTTFKSETRSTISAIKFANFLKMLGVEKKKISTIFYVRIRRITRDDLEITE